MMYLTALGVWDRKTIMQSRKAWYHCISKAVLPGIQKILKICIWLLQLFIQTLNLFRHRKWMWFCISIFQEKEFLHFWERQREPKITQTTGMCQGYVRVYCGIKKLLEAIGKMRGAEEKPKSLCPIEKKIILKVWNCPNYYYLKIQAFL